MSGRFYGVNSNPPLYCPRCGTKLDLTVVSARRRKASCPLRACEWTREWTERSKYAFSNPGAILWVLDDPNPIPGMKVARLRKEFMTIISAPHDDPVSQAHLLKRGAEILFPFSNLLREV